MTPDYNPPGSSVHGISQARILDGLPFPSPGDLLDPGVERLPPALQADCLLSEPPGKSQVKVRAAKIHLSEERLCLGRCAWWNLGSG